MFEYPPYNFAMPRDTNLMDPDQYAAYMYSVANNQPSPGLRRANRNATLNPGDGFQNILQQKAHEQLGNAIRQANAVQPMDFSMGAMDQLENPTLSLPGNLDPSDPMADILPKGTGAQVDMNSMTKPSLSDDATGFTKDKELTYEEQIASEAPEPSLLGMLPAVGNVVSLFDGLASGPEKTRLDRVNFDTVDYNPIIAANNADIRRGTNTGLYNVRNNARTFGQLGATSAATSQMGAAMSGQNRARLETAERNTNAEITNRESMLNTQIANQENAINQQNREAHRARLMNDAIGIGTSIAGYGADKAMMAADFTKNQNFLGAMRYMSPIFRNLYDGKNLTLDTIFTT